MGKMNKQERISLCRDLEFVVRHDKSLCIELKQRLIKGINELRWGQSPTAVFDKPFIKKGLQRYRVLFDCGKPYCEDYTGEKALKQALKDFYLSHKAEEGGYYDVKVYLLTPTFPHRKIDISEGQFVNEMIGEILMEEELREEKSLD